MPRIRLPLALALCAAITPSRAAAYDRQVSLDLAAGWGFTPALAGLPDHGPLVGLGATLGFDDTWALGVELGWGVQPPFADATQAPFHVGVAGVEALYYIDILEVVPFFGLGLDLLPTFDGSDVFVDVAAHARVSLDYLPSREVALGIDVRPYLLLTGLDGDPRFDPVYLTVSARVSVLFDY